MRIIGLAFLVRIFQEFPVPSPGAPLHSVHFGDRQVAPGVRVDPLASQGVESGLTLARSLAMAAKPHEAWAKAGLGPVLSTSRIKRVKRSFQRACFRSLTIGAASYKGQTIYPKDVLWRFK